MSLSSCVRRSFGGRSVPPFVSAAALPAPRSIALRSRPFSLSTRLAQHHDNAETENAPDAVVAQTDDTPPPPPSDQESVPWYLQVESPTPPQQHPFSERQRLPELPPSPPPLLQPILEHVSVELGLDHLSLLDLRALDPPPALGANLIMIIGTTRSEKHLHVSADRLCRWLRTAHHLSPFADGLLGRNELKLKMRRKAKRSRLLSAVGAKETGPGDVDDGIRTGWVCVNVGRVEGGALQQPTAEGSDSFVGFGGQSDASRIVVQMMTEEKRGLIDLETLWNGILKRSVKASADKDRELDDADKRLPHASSSSSTDTQLYRPQAAYYPSGQQARSYHSSARSLQQQGAQISATSQFNPFSDTNLVNSSAQACVVLSHLVDHFKSMKPDAAIEALGKGSNDLESTPFLNVFYSVMPRFPEATHWRSHLALRCHAVRLGHPGYSADCLIEDLTNIRLACLTPTEETYMDVFRTILAPYMDKSSVPDTYVPRNVLVQALDILDRMFEDGYNPVSGPICQVLYRATAQPTIADSPTYQESTLSTEEPFTFNGLLFTLSLYGFRAAAKTSTWSDFWSMWRSFPRRMFPRSPDMYVTMFDKVAEGNSQRDAMDALRNCFPEMLREQPAIKVDTKVANAVLRCLKVAEPRAEKLARAGNRGEWAVLWIRCARALGTV